MAGRKKRKDYADKVSKKKAVKARFDDKFGNPIKKLDDLILSLKPKKKMNMCGVMKSRGGTIKGVY